MSSTTEHGRRLSWRGATGPLLRPRAPLHPIAVHFTIALTTASLISDTLARLFGAASLAATGWWTLAGSVLATTLTIATGVLSRTRLPMEEGAARAFLRLHMALGPTFFGLLAAVALWRATLWDAGRLASWWYLASLAATVLVMTAQGYLGGELVYRFGAEVEGAYRELPGHRPSAPPPPRARRPRAGAPPVAPSVPHARRGDA